MLAILLPVAAVSQTATQPALIGTAHTVNDGPGSQSDPHVSGEFVAYTSEHQGTSEIRYHDLTTGADLEVPHGIGDYDFLSDISGSRIVFTRFNGAGSDIHLFDIVAGNGGPLDPAPNPARMGATIGGATVAWVDQGFTGTAAQSEIVVHALDTGATLRLTDDLLLDYAAAVSPAGTELVWTKCQTNNSGCTVHRAIQTSTGWTAAQLPTPPGSDDRLADTDGEIVAYESTRLLNGLSETDISWQPLLGGVEAQLPLPGDQRNPAVSGRVIAFESRPSLATTNYDILVYDTRTSLLYQVTQSPDSETLTDIDIAPDGLVRVVYVRNVAGDNNVHAYTFRVQAPADECDEAPAPQEPPMEACRNPGARPLLATLSLTRDQKAPSKDSASFTAVAGEGLLCIENGGPTGKPATSGRVELNGVAEVEPNAFKKKTALIASSIQLAATNQVEASINGQPCTSYTVRIYGAAESACGSNASTLSASSLRLRSAGEGEALVIEGISLAPRSGSSEVPVDAPTGGDLAGCSSTSTGAGSAVSALLLLTLAFFRNRRPS
ncbi:MAG: hypothetical protein WBV82_07525 [Myxococcaceae bacterium]